MTCNVVPQGIHSSLLARPFKVHLSRMARFVFQSVFCKVGRRGTALPFQVLSSKLGVQAHGTSHHSALHDRLFVPQVELASLSRSPSIFRRQLLRGRHVVRQMLLVPKNTLLGKTILTLRKRPVGEQGPRGRGALDAKDADWTTDDGHPIQDRSVRPSALLKETRNILLSHIDRKKSRRLTVSRLDS